jgi:hypothetical protein
MDRESRRLTTKVTKRTKRNGSIREVPAEYPRKTPRNPKESDVRGSSRVTLVRDCGGAAGQPAALPGGAGS